jgi:peroxiredoxin
MARIKVGETFGDFTLKNQEGKEINTQGLEDKKLLLSFHPLAWTGICTKQMQELDAALDAIEKLNTVPLGISVDTSASKKAWAESMKLKELDLLADFWPHGAVADKLGVFIDKFGFSERANIVLDEDRKAVFVKVYPIKELPDLKEIISFLEKNK